MKSFREVGDVLIETYIEKLLVYGKQKGFFNEQDTRYVRNRLLEVLKYSDYSPLDSQISLDESIEEILDQIINWSYAEGLIPSNTSLYGDLLDSELMGAMMGRPSEIINNFHKLYLSSPDRATNYFYNLSIDSNYIRKSRTDKNVSWKYHSPYGSLEITINVSKPEKDVKEIEAERNAPQASYPKCLLCPENEGYMGRLNHPARQNLRVIPVKLASEQWFLQYSPYLYYNEHCILLNEKHTPMKINRKTLEKMLDFLDFLPHYFVGSNADLPIVGGSILSHDHFQGGRHEFAIEKAEEVVRLTFNGFPKVMAAILKWPLSVIRLKSESKIELIELGEEIINKWRSYEDLDNDIIPYTNLQPHNTVTPIVRFKDGIYQLDIVLRNNRTNEEHPQGIFHPHKEVHHIKKENIGLIEVMGLAVLPSRLLSETELMKKYLLGQSLSADDCKQLEIHRNFCDELLKGQLITEDNVMKVIKEGIGKRFVQALRHGAVFKEDVIGRHGFLMFLNKLGWREV